MKLTNTFFTLALASMTFGFVGCKDAGTNVETSPPPATVDAHDDHEGHAHPSEGPHHGGLIELGNEEYHAELVHDEATGSVTIYVLNAAATEQVPIEGSDITINVKHDGKPEQFKLTASPDASDPQGKSSRFVSTDAELGEHLDEEGAEPRLVLTINGKSFRGTIAHDHDHEDHDHK
ncbi:hypothetical protein [Neorhodopirellula pilleata]|uniref:Uncharacterized protein n=1 Tax=Neorhodopirellula pilleata TaxID=2714738 RepID=A0A5C6ADS0_9BACT|nr:hypothetical protein [Neorhodopirellula pilleata]TWT97211.1 hypothetical protein Pla100_23610 [Neorhodopirellula pilleata]